MEDSELFAKVRDENLEVYLIARELIKACQRQGLALTGFIFNLQKEPPVFMHIGDINETGPDLTALHLKLCDTLDGCKVIHKENLHNDGTA